MADQTAIIRSMLEELTQRGALSGSVLLTKQGETILSSGFGMADAGARDSQYKQNQIQNRLRHQILYRAKGNIPPD